MVGPFLPWTVRQQGIALIDTKPVVVSNNASLRKSAGHGGQYIKIANFHHPQYHESPEDRMTRLRPSKTGLPMHISVAQLQEFPCIYVSNTTKERLPNLEDLFSVTIPPDPYYAPFVHGDPGGIVGSDLQKVYKFVMLNRQTLLVTWYQLDGCESYFEDVKSIC